jgi:hypothetical protein
MGTRLRENQASTVSEGTDFNAPYSWQRCSSHFACLTACRIPCDIYAGMLGGQPAAVARYFGTAVFSRAFCCRNGLTIATGSSLCLSVKLTRWGTAPLVSYGRHSEPSKVHRKNQSVCKMSFDSAKGCSKACIPQPCSNLIGFQRSLFKTWQPR